jgi:hypothetical protein
MTDTAMGEAPKPVEAIPKNYLMRTGWFRSFAARQAIDAQGAPLPWYTFPAIAFLAPRLSRDFSVLEFGAGNSTLWWAAHVDRVRSIEHTEQWAQMLAPNLPTNVVLNHVPLVRGGDYCRAAGDEPLYDIIVIDGRDRVNCARQCLGALKPAGVIVWDNSDRDRYQPGYDHLTENGFRRLDFEGLGPINTYGWKTSVFYRPHNCFGI